LNTDTSRNTGNIKIIKIAVENANLCGKNKWHVMRTLLKHAKKYGNMQNMWQLHIPVKMTCLTVLVARGRITAEYG